MGANSKIEWTDHTFNPWIGCSKVHEGCAHCYAESLSKRTGKAVWGPNGTRVKTSEANWRQPLKWNREAEKARERRRVFCASLADVFEDWQGPVHDHAKNLLGHDHEEGYFTIVDRRTPYRATLDDLRRDLFKLIDQTPWLDWLLLTKRPENVRRMWPRKHCPNCTVEASCGFCRAQAALGHCLDARENVWLGTSISNQQTADRMVPELLACRDLCPVLFLSAEPLLGPIDLQRSCTLACPNGKQCERHAPTGHRIVQDSSEGGLWIECACSRLGGIGWLIVGGESGPGARPMHPDWARAIRDQCQAAGVPFFFKQWGEWSPKSHVVARPAGKVPWGTLDREGEWFPQATPWNGHDDDGSGEAVMLRVGKKAAGRLLDGREWSDFPAVPTGSPSEV